MTPLFTPTQEPTEHEKILAAQSDRMTATMQQVHMSTVLSFRETWKDKETARAMLQLYGVNAKKAFTIHSLAVQLLEAAGVTLPDDAKMPPFQYTVHDD